MIFDILTEVKYDSWTEEFSRTDVRNVEVRYAADVTDWADVSDEDVIDGLAQDWTDERGGTFVTVEQGTGEVEREAAGSVVVRASLHVTYEYDDLDRYADVL